MKPGMAVMPLASMVLATWGGRGSGGDGNNLSVTHYDGAAFDHGPVRANNTNVGDGDILCPERRRVAGVRKASLAKVCGFILILLWRRSTKQYL